MRMVGIKAYKPSLATMHSFQVIYGGIRNVMLNGKFCKNQGA